MSTVAINISGREAQTANETSKAGYIFYNPMSGAGNMASYELSSVAESQSFNDPLRGMAVNINGLDNLHDKSTDSSRAIEIILTQDNATRIFGGNSVSGVFNTRNDVLKGDINFTWNALENFRINPIGFQSRAWATNDPAGFDNVGKIIAPSGSIVGVDPFAGFPWFGSELRSGTGGGGIGRAGADAAIGGATPPCRDPLVLDLDGDGIETTGTLTAALILFDHDGDGVKTGTGWVKPDDGFLVLDRNGNGSIDSGRELFGADTLKRDGKFATDGFDALKDLDANKDGRIDPADSVFANLRIWRDLNQDGISQANELTTLSANRITGIGVNASAVRIDLGNGNVQTAAGTFTRSNSPMGMTGETNGAVANLDLEIDTFYRQFTDQITLTAQANALPTLRGSGRVRDLNEAISLSTDLGDWVQTYVEQTTRQGQIDRLDGFIEKWADTSDLKPLSAQANGLSGSGVKLTYVFAGLTAGTPAYDDFVRKLGVVERFVGFTFGGTNGQARLTPLDASSGNLTVSLAAQQVADISSAYELFKTDVYESLVAETRLKAYSKLLLEGSQSASKFSALEDAFTQAIAVNPQQGIIDLVEFVSSVGAERLASSGWAAVGFLVTQLNSAPELGAFSEDLSSWTVRFGVSGEGHSAGTKRPDLLLCLGTDDTVSTYDGNDIVLGAGGNDSLYAGDGFDILSGGTGDDLLDGGAGGDTYLFNKGDGADTIADSDLWGNSAIDKLVLGAGITAAGTTLSRQGDDVILKFNATDTARIRGYANPNNRIEIIQFADNTVWDSATIFSRITYEGTASDDTLSGLYQYANRIDGLAGNDVITGGVMADILNGGAGNDTLTAYDGADILAGGTGDDTLDGGAGSDTYLFNEGDGADTLVESDMWGHTSADKLLLGAGITAADTTLSRQGDDIILKFNATDSVRLRGYAKQSNRGQIVQFADNTVWDYTTIQSKITYDGTAGDDTLNGFYGSANRINGLAGNDVITGGMMADILNGDAGNDTLRGRGGDNILNGGAGNDTLSADEGADTLAGGTGDDILDGGAGGDTYLFNKGDGADTIAEADLWLNTEADKLLLGAGIKAADTTLSRRGDDVILKFNATDSVRMRAYANQSTRIESVQFADSTMWDYATIASKINYEGTAKDDTLKGFADQANRINGLAGNDSITGGAMADILNGGAGDDILDGGAGSDTYRFNKGDGADTIADADSWGDTSTDKLLLGAGITAAGTTLSRRGDDVILKFNATDSVQLQGYVTQSTRIETVQFADGKVWDSATIASKIVYDGTTSDDTLNGFYEYANRINGLAGNDFITGGMLADILNGGAGSDTLSGDSGNDTLAGGSGNDLLDGGTGSDTYRFNKGDGADTLADSDSWGNTATDKLVLGAGITTAGTTLSRQGDDVILKFNATDSVRMQGYANQSTRIETIQFADATMWDYAKVGGLLTYDGSAGADNLNGFADLSNRINGLAGDDIIAGGNRDDVIDGGVGNDQLYGGEGRDTLFGGSGNDTFDGGAGADTMAGGLGDDSYFVDHLSDVVTEAVNAGIDNVQSLVTYTLAANLENLTLTGSGAINGSGNTLGNTITGNNAANVLDGGAGADTLSGGAGSDTYVVDNIADVVIEKASQGTDTVNTSVTHTLAANVENLNLKGAAAINGTGNALINIINGNAAANTLSGGAGNDTLNGGAGNDTYLFGRGDGADVITDTDATKKNADVLKFGAGIAADQLWFSRAGTDLAVSVIGTNDKVSVKGWFASANNQIEKLQVAKGQSLLNTQVLNLVNAMAAFAPPAFGQTTLSAKAATALKPVIAANWK